MTPPVKWIDPEDLAAEVEAFGERYWPSGRIPVDIDHIVDVELCLDVVSVVGLLDDNRLDAWLSADRTTIFIDADCYLREDRGYPRHRRFTLGEEAGHWALHRYLYDEVEFDTLEGFLAFHRGFDDRQVARFEWQAKTFSAMLLVPDVELRRRFEHETERLARRDHELEVAEEAQVDLVCRRIGRYFEVSGAVVKRRGYALRLWGFEY